MCRLGRDSDDGAEGGGAVAPACQEGEGRPRTVPAALVEVRGVVADGGRGVGFGLHDEHWRARVPAHVPNTIVDIGGLAEGEVAVPAHGRVAVVDVDVRRVVPVERDADFEGVG